MFVSANDETNRHQAILTINELNDNNSSLRLLFGARTMAVQEYSKAIRIDSNYAEAYFNRALAHLQLYDKVSGCADLDKSSALGYEKANDLQSSFCAF